MKRALHYRTLSPREGVRLMSNEGVFVSLSFNNSLCCKEILLLISSMGFVVFGVMVVVLVDVFSSGFFTCRLRWACGAASGTKRLRRPAQQPHGKVLEWRRIVWISYNLIYNICFIGIFQSLKYCINIRHILGFSQNLCYMLWQSMSSMLTSCLS